ncbi:MAG: endonuclease domain-containing protein [Candidatus Vogelbacteria bacterium]|nr:endonuclease domain-containing protein [Candidatus Vogelbacteria bacterium]
MIIIFNQKKEASKRKLLRNSMPTAEVILWSKLKNRQVKGYKFRRQYGVGKFVIDFFCPTANLAIELDGESHFESQQAEDHDQTRQKFIESCGIRFLRFINNDIYRNLDGVLKTIWETLNQPPRPPATPP